QYYTSRTHLVIDKSIKRFTGRAKEIVNIPSKLTPKGFKIWVLVNKGYIINWLFYLKKSTKG
ncbi:pea pathogenicity protein, partial [Zopfia rhizophila CBS 207.26]